jgi:hypothetical protein
MLDEMREKKLEFPRQLEALTKESVKNNYARYLSFDDTTKSGLGWRDSQDHELSFGEVDFPTLSDKSEQTRQTRDTETDENRQPNEEGKSAWGEKKNLFPGAPPARKPTVAQLEYTTKPSPRMEFESMDPDDPDNPSFNAARYYSDIIEQYICPKAGCG